MRVFRFQKSAEARSVQKEATVEFHRVIVGVDPLRDRLHRPDALERIARVGVFYVEHFIGLEFVDLRFGAVLEFFHCGRERVSVDDNLYLRGIQNVKRRRLALLAFHSFEVNVGVADGFQMSRDVVLELESRLIRIDRIEQVEYFVLENFLVSVRSDFEKLELHRRDLLRDRADAGVNPPRVNFKGAVDGDFFRRAPNNKRIASARGARLQCSLSGVSPLAQNFFYECHFENKKGLATPALF